MTGFNFRSAAIWNLTTLGDEKLQSNSAEIVSVSQLFFRKPKNLHFNVKRNLKGQ